MSRKIKRLKIIRTYFKMHPENHSQDSWGIREKEKIISLCIGGAALLFFSKHAVWISYYGDTDYLIAGSDTLGEIQKILGLSYEEANALVYADADESAALKYLDHLISLGK